MEILSNQYILLALTFAVFYMLRRLQAYTGWVLLNPILITIILIIGYLKLTNISFETYHETGKLIDFWLKPAIVALGVPLYQQLHSIKQLWLPILISQFTGCLVGIVSVVVTAQLLGAPKNIVVSLASKSVTTPIAMEVTESLGGIPSLTAAIVIITGIVGAIMGFKTLKVGHVSSPIARSISMGTASHAVGASAAMGWSGKHGAYASLGITLNGILTALFTPAILRVLGII